MDSGQIDFYQHDKVCTNTCRSTKFDLLISSARAPVPGQQSVVQTPTSADGRKPPGSGTSFPLVFSPFLGLLNQVSHTTRHLLPGCSGAVREAALVSGRKVLPLSSWRADAESGRELGVGSSGWRQPGELTLRDPSWLGAPCEVGKRFLMCFLPEGL